jgi:hypothetical protein
MRRSPAFFRYATRLSALSIVLAAAACGDDTSDGGAGTVTEAGAGSDGSASGNDGGAVTADTTSPTIASSYPVGGATGVATTATISADFSEAMAAATLGQASFSLKNGTADVPGEVTSFDNTVAFSPSSDLALNTTYTATITTAATDVAGNALAAAYSWSFTTDATAPVGPSPVRLGAAGKYAILAKSAISNVPTSAVTGNVGLSPAAASYITGFSLTKAGTSWSSPQIVGGVFAADNDPPTPSNLTTAVGNMQTAYTDAAGRPTPQFNDLGAGTIGGLVLTPGLYKWSSSVTIPTDITLSGAANDTWIFQITGDLKMSEAKKMTLIGGARAKNIVWQVAGAVDLGTTSHAEGIVLSQTAITMGTGASINGRLLAQTAVTIASSTVTTPAP